MKIRIKPLWERFKMDTKHLKNEIVINVDTKRDEDDQEHIDLDDLDGPVEEIAIFTDSRQNSLHIHLHPKDGSMIEIESDPQSPEEYLVVHHIAGAYYLTKTGQWLFCKDWRDGLPDEIMRIPFNRSINAT